MMNMMSLNTLTLDEAVRAAPAMAGYKAAHLTERYALAPTVSIVEGLLDRGFMITGAKQDHPRQRDPMTVRHLVTMVHRDAIARTQALAPAARMGSEGVPTVLLWNSHNGKTSLRMDAGYFRFICANGLMVGTTEDAFSFRHSIKPLLQLPEAMDLIIARQELAVKRSSDWKQIELDDQKVVSFAERAAQIRFGQSAASYPVSGMLAARREDDEGRDLWRVMNRVQENLMSGGLEGRNTNARRVRSGRINNITVDLAFNRGLWQLAEEFAQAA